MTEKIEFYKCSYGLVNQYERNVFLEHSETSFCNRVSCRTNLFILDQYPLYCRATLCANVRSTNNYWISFLALLGSHAAVSRNAMDCVYGRRCDSDDVDHFGDISMFVSFQETVKKNLNCIIIFLLSKKMLSVYLLWIVIHYCIAVTFVNWCVDYGAMTLPIVSDDKQCIWLQWLVYNEIGALITLFVSIIIIIYSKW